MKRSLGEIVASAIDVGERATWVIFILSFVSIMGQDFDYKSPRIHV